MKQAGITPTIWTYGALVNAYCRSNQLQKGIDLVGKLHRDGPKPNHVINTTLINGCLAAGDTRKAWAMYEVSVANYGPPDEVMLNTMIHTAAMNGQVERAMNLFNEMEIRKIIPTEVTFTSLINACSKRGDCFQKVFLLAEQMEAHGYKPNTYTYAAILHACARQGELLKAHAILKKMKDEKIKPTTIIYNTMLDVYANSMKKLPAREVQSLAEAKAIFRQMSQSKMEIDIITLTSYLGVLAEALKVEEAEEFLEKGFREFGIDPNKAAYTTMISMYCRAKMIDKAEKLYEEIRKRGEDPGFHIFRHFANYHMAQGNIDKAKGFIAEIHKRGFVLSPRDFRALRSRMAGSYLKRLRAKEIKKYQEPENAERLIESFSKYEDWGMKGSSDNPKLRNMELSMKALAELKMQKKERKLKAEKEKKTAEEQAEKERLLQVARAEPYRTL